MSDFFMFRGNILSKNNIVKVSNSPGRRITIDAVNNSWTWTMPSDEEYNAAWEGLQLELLGPPAEKEMLKLVGGKPGEDDKDSVCEVSFGPHRYGYNPFIGGEFCQDCGACQCCPDDGHMMTRLRFVGSDED